MLPIAIWGSGCGKPVETFEEGSKQAGYASWYGGKFHGRKTASGEIYDMNAMTAAHRTAPFGTLTRVTNLNNGRSTTVRINDRGPFVKGRIIDLSYAAAREIDLVGEGTAKVRLKFIGHEEIRRKYFVQVGSYRLSENAQEMLDELSRRFPKQQAHIRTSDRLHRVRLGPLASESAAAKLIQDLRQAGYEAIVVR